MTNPLLDSYPHLGKYEGEINLTAHLDSEMSADDELGNVESFGHFQLFTDLDNDSDLGDLDGTVAAILETNSQGFVTATFYESAKECQAVWSRLEAEWAAWGTDEVEESESETKYRATFYCFCGMSIPIEYTTDRYDARWKAAKYLRYLRRIGQHVTTLDKGHRWESLDPDDAAMVSDQAGTLLLEEVS